MLVRYFILGLRSQIVHLLIKTLVVGMLVQQRLCWDYFQAAPTLIQF